MNNVNNQILLRAIRKAQNSTCRYKVCCIGFNRKGDLLGTTNNIRRLDKQGMSLHAEVVMLKRFGRKVNSIVLIRTNNSGKLLPIHPCDTCRSLLDNYGITVRTIHE
jgi:cytidine deaminase